VTSTGATGRGLTRNTRNSGTETWTLRGTSGTAGFFGRFVGASCGYRLKAGQHASRWATRRTRFSTGRRRGCDGGPTLESTGPTGLRRWVAGVRPVSVGATACFAFFRRASGMTNPECQIPTGSNQIKMSKNGYRILPYSFSLRGSQFPSWRDGHRLSHSSEQRRETATQVNVVQINLLRSARLSAA
jgi:hypothetical protein